MQIKKNFGTFGGILMKIKEISLVNVLMCFSVVTIHLTSNPVILLNHDSIWYFIMFFVNKF